MAQGAGYSFSADTVAGSLVRDLAGYFMTGTITGSAAIAAGGGKYGDGLNCTGGAMRVAAIDQFLYPVNTDGGITVAAWVKLNNTTAAARCIASASAASALRWALYASNASGNVEVKIAGVTYSTTTSIRDGAVHHVMVVLDTVSVSHTLTVYVDGVSVLAVAATAVLTYGGAVTMDVGRNALASTEPLNGIVSDFRWWNDPVEASYVSTIVAVGQADLQVAIYPFDDDTTNDASIYSRHLTKSASGAYGVGFYGRQLASTSTEAAASGAVNFGDVDRMAITGWIRLNTAPVGSSAPILAISDTSGTNKVRIVVNTDRTVTSTWVTIYGTYSVTSTVALTVGTWSRFHFAMNPTYVSLRIDASGLTITNTSNPVPHLTPAILDLKTLYIGGDAAAGGQVSFDYLNFTRNFVDVPTSLYWTGPVNTTAAKPSNLARVVAEFNENAGTSGADASGNGNNVTLQTAGSWVAGVEGSALGANGTGPGAAKTSGLVWSAAPLGWAAACWVKVHVTGSGTRIIILKTASADVAHMGYLSGAMWVRLYGAGGTTGVVNPSAAPLATETWTHIAASCNGDTIQFFVNGEWKASAPYASGALLSPTILNIGGDNNGDAATANVDSLQMFDTPISRGNVLWLFQNPGQFIPAAPPAFQGWGVPL